MRMDEEAEDTERAVDSCACSCCEPPEARAIYRYEKKSRSNSQKSPTSYLLTHNNNGKVISVSFSCVSSHFRRIILIAPRKFEHSGTFSLIASASSNAIWTRDQDVSGSARHTGAGRAIVGAGEEVLCWDVKKGELLGRWHDSSCTVQASAITQSQTDEDIFAVG